MNAPLLAMRGISKRFGAVQACAGVDLTLHAGEILGLLGENGAGKTSLMNVLFGTYTPDEGTIAIEGRPVAIRNSAAALKLGIGMVHQHFQLVPRHTVLENLLVGRAGPEGRLSRRTVLSRLAAIVSDFHLTLDPDRLVGDLSVGEQQRVEIAKSLVRGARILVLDEPTATLTPREADGLFTALRAMAARGMGIIFISHKLGEVIALMSRLMIMRHGRLVAERANSGELSKQELARMMCGRELRPAATAVGQLGEPLLALDHVSTRGAGGAALRDVSLTLRAGEIVGMAGVSGNGQRELADVVAGVLVPASGSIAIIGGTHRGALPATDAGTWRRPRARGSHDGRHDRRAAARRKHGVALDRSAALQPASASLIGSAMRRFAAEQIARFDIRTTGPAARTATLSGGNLQKALLARELARHPRILLAAQPTRGIDVGATEFIHGEFLAAPRRVADACF